MVTNFRMRGSVLLLTPVLIGSFFLCGCVSYTLRKAQIGGPIVQSPIRLVADKKHGDVELTSYVSAPLNTVLSEDSTGAPSAPGLSWTLPDLNAGVHVERALSDHWVGGLGLSYSRVSLNDEVDQHFGGEASLGVYWSQPNWGLRTDVSAIMQQNSYAMEFLKQEDSVPDQIIKDRGQGTSVKGAFSVTLNSSVESWPANLFASWQVGSNSFYKFTQGGSNHRDRDFAISFQSYTLGLFRDIGDRMRIAAGLRTDRGLKIDEVGMVVEPVSEVVMQISFRNR